MIRRPTSHTLLRNVTAGSAWGVLPLKNPEHAKTRLAAALTVEERRKLFRAMAEDVLAALSGAGGLEGTVVVTRDTWAQALAEEYGAAVLEEPANRGQSPAVADAAAALAGAGAGAALALPGDVPLVSPAEIDRVLAAHGAAPSVTLAPAGDGRGTNCVASSPPDAIPFHFGHDSFRPHKAEARALGIEPRIVTGLPGIALDVDKPEDLRMLLAQGGACRALAWLGGTDIPARLAAAPNAANHTNGGVVRRRRAERGERY